MTALSDFIAEARRLHAAWPGVHWCVIQRPDQYRLKLLNGRLGGHRLGVDYHPHEIIWQPWN